MWLLVFCSFFRFIGLKLLIEENRGIFGKTIVVAYSIAPTMSAYFARRLPSPLREGEEVRVDFIAARVRSSSFRLRRHFRRITRGTMRSGNRQEDMWTRSRSCAGGRKQYC